MAEVGLGIGTVQVHKNFKLGPSEKRPMILSQQTVQELGQWPGHNKKQTHQNIDEPTGRKHITTRKSMSLHQNFKSIIKHIMLYWI